MKACLTKLGLSVTEEQNVPSLSHIHLSSLQTPKTSELLRILKEIITIEEGEEYIKDDNDKFHVIEQSVWNSGSLYQALPSLLKDEKTDHDTGSGGDKDTIADYNTITKEVLVHELDHPATEDTPYFNHESYYNNLSSFNTATPGAKSNFGHHLLSGPGRQRGQGADQHRYAARHCYR